MIVKIIVYYAVGLVLLIAAAWVWITDRIQRVAHRS